MLSKKSDKFVFKYWLIDLIFIFFPFFLFLKKEFGGLFQSQFSSIFSVIFLVLLFSDIRFLFRKRLKNLQIKDDKIILIYRTWLGKEQHLVLAFEDMEDVIYDNSATLIIRIKNHKPYKFIVSGSGLYSKIIALQERFYQQTKYCNIHIPLREAKKLSNFDYINHKEQKHQKKFYIVMSSLWVILIVLYFYLNKYNFQLFFIFYYFIKNTFDISFESVFDLKIDGDKVYLYIKSDDLYKQICFRTDAIHRINYEENEIFYNGQLTLVFKSGEVISLPVKIHPDNSLHEKILQLQKQVNENSL